MFGRRISLSRLFDRRDAVLGRLPDRNIGSRRTNRRTRFAASAAIVSLVGGLMVTSVGSGVQAAPVGQGFNLNAADLRFILTQIKIAEEHVTAPGYACEALLGPSVEEKVPSPVLPFGLRSVDGSCNNLQPGQGDFGRADELFPRMLTPNFRDAEGFDPPGPDPFGPTSYTQTSGFVADSQPRTVSNLVVDQTASNPAAVAAAGEGAVADPITGSFFIPNAAPDTGLSAPYNSVFTFFGQFFDRAHLVQGRGGGQRRRAAADRSLH